MLKDKIEQANKSEYASNASGWFKMKEGVNQFRILTEPEVMFENFQMGICYHQCGYEGSPKYLARVLDRADNKVKLYKIPFTIFETISGFEQDDELKFSGFPMPYDVKVTAVGAGTKEVKYTVLPSLKQVPVDATVLAEIAKQKPIPEVIEAMQQKNLEKHKADGTWQKEQDRIAKLGEDIKRATGGKAGEVDTIEYPEEDINPEDIPF